MNALRESSKRIELQYPDTFRTFVQRLFVSVKILRIMLIGSNDEHHDQLHDEISSAKAVEDICVNSRWIWN